MDIQWHAHYSAQEDWEPIQMWPINCVSECQVQMVSHKKQGPTLPTLVITISDKERKRRSSRAAGLISTNKESGSTILWFRSPSEDNQQILYDWARAILSKRNNNDSASPISPVFTSPFSSRSRDAADYFPRPPSGAHNNGRVDGRQLHHKSSTATYSTGPRDRPITFSSESPSLRSKRSDLSSPTSSQHPGPKFPIPGQHYTTVLPTDIGPSGEHREEGLDGWSSAQGRSVVNSPTHGRGSVSSQAQHQHDASDVNSPPAPGETILDRAFKFGRIGYSEPKVPGQEKLSSIARFDALMREADEKRKQREAAQRAEQMVLRSAFDADDSSDEEDDSGESSVAADYAQEQDEPVQTPLISPTAQRALAFISSRHDSDPNRQTHRPRVSRNHLSFHADSAGMAGYAPPSRPHTAHGKSRPGTGPKAQSTPHLVPASTSVDLTNIMKQASDEGVRHTIGDKRASDTSAKRLSFNELTKRLSSSSSLLLVQTNASGGSSRRSSEIDTQPSTSHRSNMATRGLGPQPPPRGHNKDDRKCGWRGSVGVVEGGFL